MASWARSWTFLGSPKPQAIQICDGRSRSNCATLKVAVFHLYTMNTWNSTKQYNTETKLCGETGVQFQPPNMCQLRVFDSDSQVQPEMHLINPFSGNACDVCKEVTTNTIDAQMRIGPSHVGQVLPWGCHLDTFQHRVLKIAILAILVCLLVLLKSINLLKAIHFWSRGTYWSGEVWGGLKVVWNSTHLKS